MTKKEKELLLKDLSARLLYHVKIHTWYGEVVTSDLNIFPFLICGLRPDGNEVEFSVNDVELIPDDWSSFRREAAKDILGAVIAKKSSMCSYGEVVEEAIKFSDELIRQIKEK